MAGCSSSLYKRSISDGYKAGNKYQKEKKREEKKKTKTIEKSRKKTKRKEGN